MSWMVLSLARRIGILCFTLTLFFTTDVHTYAPAGAWEFAGWYGGGCYPNVEFDPNIPNRVYLTSDVAGIWRSDDLGERWNFINEGLTGLNVPVLAIAPSDSNVLYAGTAKGGVCLSRDAGLHWEACDNPGGRLTFRRPDSHQSLVVSKLDPGFVAVGTSEGDVFYSRDFGAHWIELSNYGFLGLGKKPFSESPLITVLRFSPDERFLYASSESGLARYSWEKGSWEYFESSPRGISDLLWRGDQTIYAVGQDHIFVSRDAGVSWEKKGGVEKGIIYRLAFSGPEADARIVACRNQGWAGGVIISKDGGVTWSGEGQQMFPDASANPTRRWTGLKGKSTDLETNPFNPEVLFRTDWWGVWRSEDGGRTWSEKIMGAPNTVGSDLHITPRGDIYVATMDDGLLKSSDRGKSYAPVIPKRSYNKKINGHVWRVKTVGPRTVIATSSPWNDPVNQILVSQDGGRNFEIARSGLPKWRPKRNTMWKEGYPRALAVHPTDRKTVYLGIDGEDGGGFFVSKDGGYHWRRPGIQPWSKKIYNALAVDPSGPARIFWGASGDKGGVYLSENGGASWKRVFSKMIKVFDLVVSKDGVIYCAGNDKGPSLYASYDHGEKWELLQKFPGPNTTCDAITIDPRDPKRLYVGALRWNDKGGGKVYYSPDGGKEWIDLSEGLPNLPGPAAMAVHPEENKLYVLMHHGSLYKRECPDGGSS